MKIAAIAVLSLFLIIMGVQVYSFVAQEMTLGKQLADVRANLDKARSQEADLQAETEYLQNPANLQKELRERFNYKRPGETMIIIVPGTKTTTSTD